MSEQNQMLSQFAPLRWLFYIDTGNPVEQQRGRLLAGLLLLLIVLTVGLLLAGAAGAELSPPIVGSAGFLLLWIGLFAVNRRGYTDITAVVMSTALLVANLSLVRELGPRSPAAALLVLPVIAAGVTGPPLTAFVLAVLGALAYLGINLEFERFYFVDLRTGGPAQQSILIYVNLLLVGGITWAFARTTRRALTESHELSVTLVDQREELSRQLANRTRQLQATITVANSIVGTRNMDELLADTVRLIRESFGYYHVQVFLLDEAQSYAVLRQSTGEAGRKLLERGHRLPVGSLSVIGQVTATRQPVVARDTDSDAVHRRNELLPNTRSEMALPLQVGDELLGALDVQSVEPDAFEADAIPTLQALADQLAVAIQNVRLFEQAEENIRELRELSREVTHRSWAEFLDEARDEEIQQAYGPAPPALQVQRSRVMERVLNAGSVIMATGEDGSPAYLAVPVVVRNEIVGVLGIEPDSARQWTQDDLQIMQGIAERTALAVENARLYIEARRAAERERMVADIAERLQRAPSLSMLLESAAKELSAALGTENVYAEISVERPLTQRRRSVSQSDGGSAGEGASPDRTEEARAEQ